MLESTGIFSIIGGTRQGLLPKVYAFGSSTEEAGALHLTIELRFSMFEFTIMM